MKLYEALEVRRIAQKRVDADNGVYVISKANLSAGYYKDFRPDVRTHPFATSVPYTAQDVDDLLARIGKEGWEPR